MRKITISILILLTTLCLAIFPLTIKGAKAEELSSETSIMLPGTHMEFHELNKPKQVFINDTYTLVIQNDYTTVLFESVTDTYKSFSVPFGIEILDGVIFNDNLVMLVYESGSYGAYKLDLKGTFDFNDKVKLSLKESGKDLYPLSFSLLGDVLFIADNNIIYKTALTQIATSSSLEFEKVYTTSSADIKIEYFSPYSLDSFVCVTSEGSNGEYYLRINEKSYQFEGSAQNSNYKPRHITILDKNLYYTYHDGIYKLSLEKEEFIPTKILEVKSEKYLLGDVVSPQGITSFDNKIYITDETLNSVQEYNLTTDGELKFTGRAIATHSAYPTRLSSMVTDVTEINGVTYIADCLNNRVSVIDRTGEISTIDIPIENFNPRLISSNGENILLSSYMSNELLLIDLKGNVLSSNKEYTAIQSISCDKDGNYYFIGVKGQKQVFKINKDLGEDSILTITSQVNKAEEEIYNFAPKLITCDDEDNLYVFEDYATQGTVLRVFDSNGIQLLSFKNLLSADSVKIQVDNSKNVYSLSGDNKVSRFIFNKENSSYLESEKAVLKISTSIDTSKYKATSFTLNSLQAKGTFTFNGFILASKQLIISNPTFITLPNGMSKESLFEKKVASLKTAIVEKGANYYSYKLDEFDANFNIVLDSITRSTTQNQVIYLGESSGFSAILFEDKLAFVKKEKVTVQDTVENNTVPYEKAVLITDVSFYKYPLVNDNFSILRAKKRDVVIIKDKANDFTQLLNGSPVKFYLATLWADTGNIDGYIPISVVEEFTIDKLLDGNYSIIKVSSKKKIAVYSDEDKTTVIGFIPKTCEVRRYSKVKDSYLISYQSEEGTILGYIDSDFKLEEGKNKALLSTGIAILATAIFITTLLLIRSHVKKSKDK